MNLLTLKLILIFVMLFISLLFGLSPLFLYHKWAKKTRQNLSNRISIIISMLSCFSGGVILSVSWLDILPDAREFFETWEEKVGHKFKFAYVELFVALGFFLVYLIEELIGECFKANSEKEKTNEMAEMKRSSSITQYDVVKLEKAPKTVNKNEDKKSLVNIFTFVLAMAFHCFMEGFLFGAQSKVLSLSSLFFGIMIHKALVTLSISIKFSRQLEDRPKLAIGFIVFLAFASPLSALVGILIQGSFSDNLAGAVFSTVISSLSVGSFMYIALFEIIVPERNAPQSKLLQWLSCFLGFALMTTVIAIA